MTSQFQLMAREFGLLLELYFTESATTEAPISPDCLEPKR